CNRGVLARITFTIADQRRDQFRIRNRIAGGAVQVGDVQDAEHGVARRLDELTPIELDSRRVDAARARGRTKRAMLVGRRAQRYVTRACCSYSLSSAMALDNDRIGAGPTVTPKPRQRRCASQVQTATPGLNNSWL